LFFAVVARHNCFQRCPDPHLSHPASSIVLRQELHWLFVRQRVVFKPAVLTFKAKKLGQPAYFGSCQPPTGYVNISLPDFYVQRWWCYTALNRRPFQSYGASPAVWDHTVLPSTRHRWTSPAL